MSYKVLFILNALVAVVVGLEFLFKNTIAHFIESCNFLVGQPPTQRTGVLLRLFDVLRTGDWKRPLADRPVQGNLGVGFAAVVLPDARHQFDQRLDFREDICVNPRPRSGRTAVCIVFPRQ